MSSFSFTSHDTRIRLMEVGGGGGGCNKAFCAHMACQPPAEV